VLLLLLYAYTKICYENRSVAVPPNNSITFSMVLFGCLGHEFGVNSNVVMNIINHSDKLKNQKAIDTNLTSSWTKGKEEKEKIEIKKV